MVSMQAPLLPINAEEIQQRSPKSKGLKIAVGVGLGLSCLALVHYSNEIDETLTLAASATNVTNNTTSKGPLGLHHALGPLGEFLGTIYDLVRPYAYVFKFVGTVIFTLIYFISNFGQAKDFSGTSERMKEYGLPCPSLMAFFAIFSGSGGSVLLLTMNPVLRIIGACMLVGFLFMATYFGHYKPMKAAPKGSQEELGHFLACMKNFSIFASCIMMCGYELPDAQFASIFGSAIGGVLDTIANVFKPYSFYFVTLGTLLFLMLFIMSGLNHGMHFNTFVEEVGKFGLPCPQVLAGGAEVCLVVGTVGLMSMLPVFREMGSELLIMFLLPATYFAHWTAYSAACKDGIALKQKKEWNMVMKNMSLVGMLIQVIGYEIPAIGK